MPDNIRLFICEDYEEASLRAADVLSDVICSKPDCVLGLATGSTPVGLYKELIRRYEKGELDFASVRTYNLDEYFPIDPGNPQSYRYFMNETFFKHINIDLANTHVPHGNDMDIETVCKTYEKMIRAAGGLDIQVLGIGNNGHIAFNEPSDRFEADTHRVDLQESTIKANARFFEREEDVPRQAISMGIGSILRAKKILLIATGEKKAEIVKEALCGPITPTVPASALQLHADVTVITDRQAGQLIAQAPEWKESLV